MIATAGGFWKSLTFPWQMSNFPNALNTSLTAILSTHLFKLSASHVQGARIDSSLT